MLAAPSVPQDVEDKARVYVNKYVEHWIANCTQAEKNHDMAMLDNVVSDASTSQQMAEEESKLFTACDANSDGRLDYFEFMEFCEQKQQKQKERGGFSGRYEG